MFLRFPNNDHLFESLTDSTLYELGVVDWHLLFFFCFRWVCVIFKETTMRKQQLCMLNRKSGFCVVWLHVGWSNSPGGTKQMDVLVETEGKQTQKLSIVWRKQKNWSSPWKLKCGFHLFPCWALCSLTAGNIIIRQSVERRILSWMTCD